MAELKVEFDPGKALVESRGGWAGGFGDWMVAFGRSAFESIPELVGITPSQDTLRFRAEYPGAGFVSELAGMAVPYGAWFKAARGIKSIERLATAAEAGLSESPFIAAAKATAIREAPFEVGRVALSPFVGDKPLTEMGTEGALNLALGSALGGTISLIGAAGRAARPLREILPGVDEVAPPQLLLRKIDEMLPTVQGDDLARLVDSQVKLDQLARSETAPRYVDRQISGKSDELNALFKPVVKGPLEKRKLTSGPIEELETFNSEDAWRAVVKEAGLDPTRVGRDMQFPRVISFKRVDLGVKAVEAKPVYYHGTNKEFEAFDPGQLKSASGSRDALGFYFTEDPEVASFFADSPKRGRIIEAGLSVKNPKTIDLAKLRAQAIGGFDVDANKSALVKEAFDAGHDAVIFKNSSEGKGPVTTTVVVKDAAQIAQKRTGLKFDPASKSLVDHAAATLDAKALSEGWSAERYLSEAKGLQADLDALAQKLGPSAEAVQKTAARTERNITSKLTPVGDGWLALREPDNGMFVMAKKFGGELGKPSEADKWLVFKTDRPGAFATRSQTFTNAQVALEKWRVGPNGIERNAGRPGELFSEVYDLTRKFGAERYLQLGDATGGPQGIGRALDKFVPERMRGNMAVQHAHNLVREYFSPTFRQLQKSTLGHWVLNQAKIQQDLIDNWGQRLFQGQLKLDAKRPITQFLAGSVPQSTTRSIQDIIRDLDNEGLIGDFMKLWRQQADSARGTQMVAEGKVWPRAVELARELEVLDGDLFKQINRFEDAAGKSPTLRAKGHYLLSREWEGDFFNALRDESGKVIGLASGASRRAAEQEAKRLAASLAEELGRPVRPAEAFVRNNPAGMPRDVVPFVTNPGLTMQRQNIRGFKWDARDPTAQELLDAYSANISRRTRYMGTLGREALLAREVARLSVDDPFAYRVVVNRFNQMSGIEGEFSKAQNRLVDKVLAPVLGSNSASKIVRATNEGLMHLQLGFFKLSHPITNIVGTIQTIAPELAFVLNAGVGEVAGRYYSLAPAMGTRGTVGSLGWLSPLKIMSQGVRAMARPDGEMREALERAVNDRTLDPRLIEDYVGKNRSQLKDWKGAVRSPEGLWRYTLALSEWMPAASERFARVLAFTSGYRTARDVMKLEGDDAYRFAKQFTERTQYLYSSSDRPLVFTSPLGSSMGLFKNWMMNYMGAMVEYADLAINKNVWSPLAWQTIGTFAVGGAAATPLYWAAEGASQLFANKGLMQWAYDDFTGREADAIMYGLPAALTGVSLSSQMTVPGGGANPVRDAAQLFSFAIWDRAKALGGGVQSAFDNWQATGGHPASDPDVRAQLIRAFAPVNLYRYMATQEEGTVRSLATDLPQIKGMSHIDIMLYRMGLQPVALERHIAVANELYKDKQKMIAQTRAFGDAFAEASQRNDSAAMDNVLQRAAIIGVPTDSVLRSATARLRQAGETTPERLSKPAVLDRFRNVLELQ